MEDVQACFAAEWDKADGEGNLVLRPETARFSKSPHPGVRRLGR